MENDFEKAKKQKIKQVLKSTVEAMVKAALTSIPDSSMSIISSNSAYTVVLICVNGNNGIFKLAEDSSKWIDKLPVVVKALSDSTKSCEEVYTEIFEIKLPLAVIPSTQSGKFLLTASKTGLVRLFCNGFVVRQIMPKNLKNVEFFGGTGIGEYAFEFCEELEKIVIPDSVTAIGRLAFRDCKSLSSVVIPASVTYIGDYAFSGCESLVSVMISASVKSIGKDAFKGCESLSSVNFSGTMAQWEAVNDKEFNLLCFIPANVVKCSDGEWQKPVVFVKNCVFEKLLDKNVSSFVIPEGVTEIGKSAFNSCKPFSLVKFCGTMAQFEAVKGKVYLLRYISANVVKCSDGEWKKPVVLVEDGVFVKCIDKNVTSVEIPEGVTSIGKGAFLGCEYLSSVVIPKSVAEIGGVAFSNCKSLKSMKFCGTMKQWSSSVDMALSWKFGVPAEFVKCADGVVVL